LREFQRQNRPGVRIFVNNGVVASGDPDGFAAAARRCHAFPAGLLSRQKASASKAPMPSAWQSCHSTTSSGAPGPGSRSPQPDT
jgi:hypothetical protein